MKDCCFIGAGKVYAKKWVNGTLSGDSIFLGNISKFEMSVDQEEKSVPDYTSAAGGKDCSITRITGVKAALTFNCFKRDNLAMGFFGTVSSSSGATVTNYTDSNLTKVTVKPSFINLPFKGPYTGVAVSLATTNYVAGSDFVVTGTGIYIPETSTIPLGTVLEIDYTYPAQERVELLTGFGGEYNLVIDGVNAADGKPFGLILYRAKAGPASGINFIGDDFASFDITFDVLKDDSKIGSSISQYGVFI